MAIPVLPDDTWDLEDGTPYVLEDGETPFSTECDPREVQDDED